MTLRRIVVGGWPRLQAAHNLKVEPSLDAVAPPVPRVRDASLRKSVEKRQATREAAESAPMQDKPAEVAFYKQVVRPSFAVFIGHSFGRGRQ